MKGFCVNIRIAILLVAFNSIMQTCIPIKKNSLTMKLMTSNKDTLEKIDAKFYISDNKVEKSNYWKYYKNLKEASFFENIDADSFNSFNFQNLKRGRYSVLVFYTYNNIKHCEMFDSIQIQKGHNSAKRLITTDTNISINDFSNFKIEKLSK